MTVSGSITITTTYVAGGLEEISANGVGATLTKYFTGASGLPTAERVGTNGPLSYLASDGQGTVSEALDGGGNVTFAQLYTPYGATRYTSGSSPTTLGYTGQRADSMTGLDYYHARYYDPVAGQFTSADTVADGLNRYGYVGGNPTTATDPTGHRLCLGESESSCVGVPPSSGGNGGPPTIVNTEKDTTPTPTRNADGTLTITTLTTLRYTWSNGRVTTDSWSTSQTTCDQKCHHLQRADDLDKEAGKFAVGGIVFEVLAAAMDILTGSIRKVFQAILLAANLFGNVLPYIAQWAGASSGLYQAAYRLSGVFNTLAGMAADAWALISTWGDLALGAASAIVNVIRGIAMGVPGVLTNVALQAVGTIIGDGFLAASYLAWGQYDHLEEEAKQERGVAASLRDGV